MSGNEYVRVKCFYLASIKVHFHSDCIAPCGLVNTSHSTFVQGWKYISLYGWVGPAHLAEVFCRKL